MNGYRKMMIDEGGNLGWCKPYVTEDGKTAIAICEGEIAGMRFAGKDNIEFAYDEELMRPYYRKEDIERFARAVNSEYDEYNGYSALEIILDGNVRETSCSECPWFGICDAMDNPDGWEDPDYPDDEEG